MPPGSGKTEKATPRKRREERKRGNILQSRDIVGAASLMAIFAVFRIATPYVFAAMKNLLIGYISTHNFQIELTQATAASYIRDFTFRSILYSLPFLVTPMVVGIVASGIQTRFRFTASLLQPKFSKLNPLSGIKKMFSVRSVVELLKSLLKVTIVSLVVYLEIRGRINDILRLGQVDILDAAAFVGNSLVSLILSTGMALVGIGIIDYFYQWWEYERNIRMTKQEIKEEYKLLEGDPQTRGRIRERQRKMAMSRMMQRVAEADVVIRNPTHFAVALQYDAQASGAPIVVAKGQDYLALRIIEEAEKHEVQITENRELARALYATVEIDEEIPQEFYVVVAELLAYVYNLKKKR